LAVATQKPVSKQVSPSDVLAICNRHRKTASKRQHCNRPALTPLH